MVMLISMPGPKPRDVLGQPRLAMTTQRDVALRLGMSQAAVSLALSGRGRIAPATRRRVREAVRRLGWRPEPALAALARRRWHDGSAPIAYLGSQVSERDARFDRYWLALRSAARAQGVALRYVDPRLRGDAAALAEALAAAGVANGVLVGQDNSGRDPWPLAWERFAVVHCGLYAATGSGDIVCADLLAAAAEAVSRLAGGGRLAVILPMSPISLSEQLIFASLQDYVRRGAIALWSGPHESFDQVVPWLRAQQPEQILGYGDGMAEWLRRRGVRLPFAALALSEQRGQRGICIPYGAIAEQALDLLRTRIAAGERGTGAVRRIHLVPMPWNEPGDP